MVIPTFKIVESSSSSLSNSKDMTIVQHMKKAHSDSVTALSTSITGLCTNNNSMLVSSSLDSTCKFWNILEGSLLRTVSFPCPINGLAIPSSSSSLFAAGSDGSVYKASIITKSRRKTQSQEEQEVVVVKKWDDRSHVGPTESVVVVNGGTNLVSAGEDGSVWMWDIETEQVTMVMKDDYNNNSNNNNGGLLMEGISSSISDMIVVVSGGNDEYNRGRGSGGNNNNNNIIRYVSSGKLLKEEEVREMKKIMEMGHVLREVEEDKRRAIKMLENAIAMHEKLLELILEYALKGACDDDGDGDEGENEEEDKGDQRIGEKDGN